MSPRPTRAQNLSTTVGVQSFFEEDLLWMNRAHNAQQAIDNLQLAIKQFDNITIDLIYDVQLRKNDMLAVCVFDDNLAYIFAFMNKAVQERYLIFL